MEKNNIINLGCSEGNHDIFTLVPAISLKVLSEAIDCEKIEDIDFGFNGMFANKEGTYFLVNKKKLNDMCLNYGVIIRYRE